MKKLAIILALLFAFSLDAAEAVRIRSVRHVEEFIMVSQGTAFPVDATAYGYPAKRTLMTCAHVVGKAQEVYIELGEEHWIRVTPLAIDYDADVALVATDEDIDGACKLADNGARVKDKAIMYGSPLGIPIKRFEGKVTEEDWGHQGIYDSMAMKFDHGDSGAPVLNSNKELIGMAAAAPNKGNDVDHKVGLYIPLSKLKAFLSAHLFKN